MSFYIVDGHAYCYQSYYAIKNLHTSDGMPTNAVFGFIKFIKKIIKEVKQDLA